MRMNWDEYLMRMALLVSERATCERLKVGSVIVKHQNILATGYNGSASGEVHCEDVGCLVRDNHCIRTIHSEQNALIQCAKHGVSVAGSTIYVTHFPCLHCAKSLITAFVSEVVYLNDYKNDEYALELFEKAGVVVRKVEL
jgi:dCMP deaminase